MCHRICQTIIACLLLISGAALAKPGESVVRINTEHGVGTGFAWSKPRYIVTALHVVAGAKKISVYSEAKGEAASATLLTALHAPDLALLRLDRDIGLKPLVHAKVDSNDTDRHFIWGYPHDVAKMTRHQVQIVGGLNSSPTLSSIFKSDSQLKQTVGAQGFPALESRIVRIEKIQPGHSGAPVVNKAGQVVGIGDGGLRDGLGGLNWAIPAAVYLPELPNSRDPIPSGVSVQKSLFSTPTENTQPLQMGQQGTLHHVWQAQVPALLDILDGELRGHVQDLIEEATDVTGDDLSSALINIYEDDVSGATLAAPDGAYMDFDAEFGRLTVETYSGLSMMVQIGRASDWESARYELELFAEELLTSRDDWQPDPELEDIAHEDADDQFAEWLFNRVAGEPSEDGTGHGAMLEANLLADQENFLGTAIITQDSSQFDDQQWRDFYLLTLSVALADFASY